MREFNKAFTELVKDFTFNNMVLFSKPYMQLSIAFGLLFAIIAFPSNAGASDLLPVLNRQFFQNYAVVSQIGLNVRNKDCQIKGRLMYGAVLKHRERGSNTPILCVINNVAYTMYPVQFNATDNSAFFVAVIYLRQITTEFDEIKHIFKLSVNSPIGLNVRGEACEFVSRIPDRSVLKLYKNDSLNTVNCDLGGQLYAMTKFRLVDGTSRYIATSFIK